jgi:hypothetical protein
LSGRVNNAWRLFEGMRDVDLAPTTLIHDLGRRLLCSRCAKANRRPAANVGNLAPMPGVFPDYNAPIVRTGVDGPISRPPAGACRRRRTRLWRRPRSAPPSSRPRASRSTSTEGGVIWFALDETRPLACFAGIWTSWTSVRKVKEGGTTNDLYAFLTTALTTPEEVETWMTAPPDEALKLQRPAAGRLPPDRRLRRQGRPDQIRDVTFEEDGRQVRPWSALSAKAEIYLGRFDNLRCRVFRCLATMDRAPRLRSPARRRGASNGTGTMSERADWKFLLG